MQLERPSFLKKNDGLFDATFLGPTVHSCTWVTSTVRESFLPLLTLVLRIFGWFGEAVLATASKPGDLFQTAATHTSQLYNVNPGLINPYNPLGCLIGGIPFEYHIMTIWGVPP